MNRNKEYETLMKELDAMPVPEGGVGRAMRRERRRRYLTRPLAGIAAAFALFVVLVNASTTVAYACSRIPGLRELAEAVTFSRSLGDAVENDYVQTVELEQTVNDITVKVEYLIVDQKTVTVFYRFLSERYPNLREEPLVFSSDGESPPPCSYGSNNWGTPNGELRSMFIDFVSDDVPPVLRLRLKLQNMDERIPLGPPTASVWDDSPEPERPYIAEFEFLLEFDPYFTAQGRHFASGRSFTVDGQILHLTNVDVYPSYLNLTVRGDGANTAWLKSLEFYLVTDKGERFDAVSNGITAVGDPDTPEMISFRADSTFFYDANAITLYVTGAEWLDKDVETIHVNLKNAAADFMPEGTELVSAERDGNHWVLTVLKESASAQTFMSDYYDAAGKAYELREWSSSSTLLGSTPFGLTEAPAPEGYTYESFPLKNYPYGEVWLTPRYTSRWTAETPAVVAVPLK